MVFHRAYDTAPRVAVCVPFPRGRRTNFRFFNRRHSSDPTVFQVKSHSGLQILDRQNIPIGHDDASADGIAVCYFGLAEGISSGVSYRDPGYWLGLSPAVFVDVRVSTSGMPHRSESHETVGLSPGTRSVQQCLNFLPLPQKQVARAKGLSREEVTSAGGSLSKPDEASSDETRICNIAYTACHFLHARIVPSDHAMLLHASFIRQDEQPFQTVNWEVNERSIALQQESLPPNAFSEPLVSGRRLSGAPTGRPVKAQAREPWELNPPRLSQPQRAQSACASHPASIVPRWGSIRSRASVPQGVALGCPRPPRWGSGRPTV